jgi:hypothetical protein
MHTRAPPATPGLPAGTAGMALPAAQTTRPGMSRRKNTLEASSASRRVIAG